MLLGVDTREQAPYTFESVTRRAVQCRIERATLRTGDYAVARPEIGELQWRDAFKGYPGGLAVVERKSLADLYGSLGGGRARFEREFARMAECGYAALVIEADWPAILRPNEHLRHATSIRPRSVVATLLAWSQRYRVHVFPCPDRSFAEKLTYRILERWYRDGSRH